MEADNQIHWIYLVTNAMLVNIFDSLLEGSIQHCVNSGILPMSGHTIRFSVQKIKETANVLEQHSDKIAQFLFIIKLHKLKLRK